MIPKLVPRFKHAYKIANRGMQHSAGVNSQFTDFKFDVPWGTIRGKWWGSMNKQPMLALHGYMDNSASFDALAPLLKNSSILAIDLPGHGLSSWFPKGIPYHINSVIILIKSISDHYGWKKIKLLGHSMGGMISFAYTQLFSEEIQFTINIDSFGLLPYDLDTFLRYQKKSTHQFIKFEKKASSNIPSYSKEEAMKRWIDANEYSSLDSYTLSALFNRGSVKQDDGKYRYSRDFRLKFAGIFYNFNDQDEIDKMAGRIKSPFLVLRASKSPMPWDTWNSTAEVLSKSNKDFRLKLLDAGHHMHITSPQLIADELNQFLMEYDK